jgi:hypothetical protein
VRILWRSVWLQVFTIVQAQLYCIVLYSFCTALGDFPTPNLVTLPDLFVIRCGPTAVVEQFPPFLASDLGGRAQHADNEWRRKRGRKQLSFSSFPPLPFHPSQQTSGKRLVPKFHFTHFRGQKRWTRLYLYPEEHVSPQTARSIAGSSCLQKYCSSTLVISEARNTARREGDCYKVRKHATDVPMLIDWRKCREVYTSLQYRLL